MNIVYANGDIFDAEVEALVNPVNCTGVAGRGLAREFRSRFPANCRAYVVVCNRGDLKVGSVFVFGTRRPQPQYIINFPTKRHWRHASRLEDIELGLAALVREIERRGIRSVAVPALGCGLGGLQWDQVRPLMARAFAGLRGVRVVVFNPNERDEDDIKRPTI